MRNHASPRALAASYNSMTPSTQALPPTMYQNNYSGTIGTTPSATGFLNAQTGGYPLSIVL